MLECRESKFLEKGINLSVLKVINTLCILFWPLGKIPELRLKTQGFSKIFWNYYLIFELGNAELEIEEEKDWCNFGIESSCSSIYQGVCGR